MQDQGNKTKINLAIDTAEKILKGINDDTFQGYVTQALNILRQGQMKSGAAGPQTDQGQGPPPGGGPPEPMPQPQLPPTAGSLPA
jgi:hypothetical protein